jgi:hypothetical protein
MYLDRTYCASPNCKKECGRKLPDAYKGRDLYKSWLSMGYFCGKPIPEVNNEQTCNIRDK